MADEKGVAEAARKLVVVVVEAPGHLLAEYDFYTRWAGFQLFFDPREGRVMGEISTCNKTKCKSSKLRYSVQKK